MNYFKALIFSCIFSTSFVTLHADGMTSEQFNTILGHMQKNHEQTLRMQTELFTKALADLQNKKKSSGILSFAKNHYLITGAAIAGVAYACYHQNELGDLIDRRFTQLRAGINALWRRLNARFDALEQQLDAQHAQAMAAINTLQRQNNIPVTEAVQIPNDRLENEDVQGDLFPADTGPSYFSRVQQWARNQAQQWISWPRLSWL